MKNTLTKRELVDARKRSLARNCDLEILGMGNDAGFINADNSISCWLGNRDTGTFLHHIHRHLMTSALEHRKADTIGGARYGPVNVSGKDMRVFGMVSDDV